MTTHADRIAFSLLLMRQQRGIPVTLVRGDGVRVSIDLAIKVNPVAETSSSQGSARRLQTISWLIAAADLTHEAATFLPEKDQTIEVVVGSNLETYRIQPFAGNGRGNVYELSDAAGSQFRIHSNFIKSEPVAP